MLFSELQDGFISSKPGLYSCCGGSGTLCDKEKASKLDPFLSGKALVFPETIMAGDHMAVPLPRFIHGG